MTTNDTGDWRELFEVALFEPERVKLDSASTTRGMRSTTE
jgi:hypothetical protein